MYSREKKIKAVELWLKYDKSEADVIHELGYPSHKMLAEWHKELQQENETGIIRDSYDRYSIYSRQQKQAAVNHYLEHGKNISRTVRILGYPSKQALAKWCEELAPKERKRRSCAIQYSSEQKKNAVIDLCSRQGSAQEIARKHGATRTVLYKWKDELLGKESAMAKTTGKADNLPNDKEKLLSEIEALKRDIQRLKMEKDILEAAAELIKKDPGVDLKDLSNREKTILVGALKSEHPPQALLTALSLARSSYYYQCWAQRLESKYAVLKARIIELFDENNRSYGYRRIHFLLSQEETIVSEKVVRTLMAEAGLVAQIKRRRKYNSYQGEVSPAPKNLLARDFRSKNPNEKWLTDISEFHIPAGKAYLSPIVDCYDGKLVSWTISTRPDAELVNTMLDLATETLGNDEKPIIHSDRGGHYRWPGWLERVEKAGLVRSMSKKGCSPDNSACEGLFGRIKMEMFYSRPWVGITMEDFLETLDKYLHWYNNKRIKMSLGGMSPVQYRLSLGLEIGRASCRERV